MGARGGVYPPVIMWGDLSLEPCNFRLPHPKAQRRQTPYQKNPDLPPTPVRFLFALPSADTGDDVCPLSTLIQGWGGGWVEVLGATPLPLTATGSPVDWLSGRQTCRSAGSRVNRLSGRQALGSTGSCSGCHHRCVSPEWTEGKFSSPGGGRTRG